MSVAAPVDRLVGCQLPRVEVRPPFVSSTGVEAVELAASAGLVLDPWQAHVLDVILAEGPDGRWAAFEAACLVSRQNGKGGIAEALILADLFLLGTPLVIYSAHLFTTTSETISRIVGLVENSDFLSRRVSRIRRAAGTEAVELRSGARLRFLARSNTSGRGFTAGRLILDEAQILGSQAMAAIIPTLTTAPNPQIVYLGTAPLPESDYWRGIRRRGHGDGDAGRLAFMEWSADPDTTLTDRGGWAQANPALGYRITEQYIADELAALPAEQFARERLSITPAGESGRAVPVGVWDAGMDPRSQVDGDAAVSFAVDVSPGGRSASICVAGLRADGCLHGELVERRDGTDWLVGEIRRLAATWPTSVVAVDPNGPAGPVAADLAAAGVPVRVVSGRDLATAAAGLLAGLESGHTRVRPHPLLDAAVDAARSKAAGDGGWSWTRRDTSVDISPIVALSLAVWAGRLTPDYDLAASVW